MASNSYGTINNDLQKAFVEVIKKICIKNIETIAETNELSLEVFLACRLILLDRNPDLGSIATGEVLRRITGKVGMKIVKKDVIKAAGCLQLCIRQEAGIERAINAMPKMFHGSNTTQYYLLMLKMHSITLIKKYYFAMNIYSRISYIYLQFLHNTSKIIHHKKIRLLGGTTQRDSTAMAIYARGLAPHLCNLQSISSGTKHWSC